MANEYIGKTTITDEGRKILAACQTGKTLHFSKFCLSDGYVDEDTDIPSMTAMVNESKFDAPIVETKVLGNGNCQIRASLSNKNLTSGFFIREIGLFAIHPDTGAEVLYAYLNEGDRPDYIPAGGSDSVYNLEQTIETVIDRAQNITATIDGSSVFITYSAFNEHVNSTNPHPNTPTKMADITSPSGLWGVDNDANLHKVSIEDVQKAILGTSGGSYPVLAARVAQHDILFANLLTQQTASEDTPDCNLIITEDFEVPDMIDMFKIRVSSVVAGSNSIDLESLNGIIVKANYWISDGRSQEYVKVESVTKNGATNRVLLTSPLKKTYSDTNTYLYRTTAEIQNSKALGSGEQKGFSIVPDLTWSGIKGSTENVMTLDTSISNASSFDVEGDIEFRSGGFISLAS